MYLPNFLSIELLCTCTNGNTLELSESFETGMDYDETPGNLDMAFLSWCVVCHLLVSIDTHYSDYPQKIPPPGRLTSQCMGSMMPSRLPEKCQHKEGAHLPIICFLQIYAGMDLKAALSPVHVLKLSCKQLFTKGTVVKACLSLTPVHTYVMPNFCSPTTSPYTSSPSDTLSMPCHMRTAACLSAIELATCRCGNFVI
jgi:hypothetical protein